MLTQKKGRLKIQSQECPYIRICYAECQSNCYLSRTMDDFLKVQVHKSRTGKRIIRGEHGHNSGYPRDDILPDLTKDIRIGSIVSSLIGGNDNGGGIEKKTNVRMNATF